MATHAIRRFRRPLVLGLVASAVAIGLGGCDPVSLTLLGVGANAGISHQLGGIAYKTFAEPLPRVKRATLAAMNRMAITVDDVEKTNDGETIHAKAGDRNIEVDLEKLTSTATRIRAVARKNSLLFVDSATAVELIVQTEKGLGT